ncbi:hypothetical protein V8C86DRAFT_2700370 [Haematococcus lacustris]
MFTRHVQQCVNRCSLFDMCTHIACFVIGCRCRRLPLRPLAADYDVYKKAIMGDIVARRMYKAVDLRKLFQKYLRGAPLHEKQVVEHVVADIKTELLVRSHKVR